MAAPASSTNRALLIGSPFQGLAGPVNDVLLLSSALAGLGFSITTCVGDAATRDGILKAWNDLIDSSRDGDAVVIYYSGHGGLVTTEAPSTDSATLAPQPDRYQFICPIDFGSAMAGGSQQEFRGILNAELSYYLRRTTDKTHNVTMVIDSCYSGRICRLSIPLGSGSVAPVPRGLPEVVCYDVVRHLDALKQKGEIPEKAYEYPMGNPHAVRIFASMPTEQSWEALDLDSGVVLGLMTKWLVRAIRLSSAAPHDPQLGVHDGGISWSKTMLMVREMVELETQGIQHPTADGPTTRYHFSTKNEDERAANVFAVEFANGIWKLRAGTVSGVRVGDVFTIVPYSDGLLGRTDHPVGTSKVIWARGFTAGLSSEALGSRRSGQGLLAIKTHSALTRLPVVIPESIAPLRQLIVDRSEFIRSASAEDGTDFLCLVHQHQDGSLSLYTRPGVEIHRSGPASSTDDLTTSLEPLVVSATRLAKAQNLLSLKCSSTEEHLRHDVQVKIHTAQDGLLTSEVATDGTGVVADGQRLCISLLNNSTATVYCHVFDVNVRGKVTYIPKSDESEGIELGPHKRRVIGAVDGAFAGLELSWPEGVHVLYPDGLGQVTETLVVIFTSGAVNLQHLVDREDGQGDDGSELFRRTMQLATGCTRDLKSCDESKPPSSSSKPPLQYDVLQIPFAIQQAGIPRGHTRAPLGGPEIEEQISEPKVPGPEPEGTLVDIDSVPELDDITDPENQAMSPTSELVPKSVFGWMWRTVTRVPPRVVVVNKHSVPIWVFVSRYKPVRVLTGVGVNAGPEGGGLNVECSMFPSPVAKKKLAAYRPESVLDGDRSHIGTFPLWTRYEGHGVISIFLETEKDPFIVNDSIPLGVTAYCDGNPDLKLVEGIVGGAS